MGKHITLTSFFSVFFSTPTGIKDKLTEHRQNLRKVSSSLTLSTLPLPTATQNHSQCASYDIEGIHVHLKNGLSKKWKHY